MGVQEVRDKWRLAVHLSKIRETKARREGELDVYKRQVGTDEETQERVIKIYRSCFVVYTNVKCKSKILYLLSGTY
jgi:hypothetical protein